MTNDTYFFFIFAQSLTTSARAAAALTARRKIWIGRRMLWPDFDAVGLKIKFKDIDFLGINKVQYFLRFDHLFGPIIFT